MRRLHVQPVWELPEREESSSWLIRGLWAHQAVGILGGEPKSYKSFLALQMAVAVASGAPCLERYPVERTGRVLLYAAEDAQPDVRRRLEGICQLAGVTFSGIDIHAIVEPSVRLDVPEDQQALERAVEELRPTLLILDPFVRLHRADENVSSQIVPLLAHLRDLQRSHGCAVAVVHHARKGGAHLRPGQALRGTSEFHGWGDSNLYVRRRADGHVTLDTEHRSAPAGDPITLRLEERAEGVALRVVAGQGTEPPHRQAGPTPEQRLIEALSSTEARSFGELRRAAAMRTETFSRTLSSLVSGGQVSKSDGAYRLVP